MLFGNNDVGKGTQAQMVLDLGMGHRLDFDPAHLQPYIKRALWQ